MSKTTRVESQPDNWIWQKVSSTATWRRKLVAKLSGIQQMQHPASEPLVLPKDGAGGAHQMLRISLVTRGSSSISARRLMKRSCRAGSLKQHGLIVNSL